MIDMVVFSHESSVSVANRGRVQNVPRAEKL